MFANYLKTALRNIERNKAYSAINIFGFSVGIASCLMLTLFVQDELMFDRFNEHSERIYRIRNDVRFSGSTFNYAVTAAPLAAQLKKDFPEVEAATRFKLRGTLEVRSSNRTFREENIYYTDPDFFHIFSVSVLHGDGFHALGKPNTVVLTEEIATKYFGSDNPIGKTFEIQGINYSVGAVMKQLPSNSHFHCNILISMVSFVESKSTVWASNNFQTYVLLKKGADARTFESKLTPFVEHYFAPELKSALNMDIGQFHSAGNYFVFSLQPLLNIHLHSHLIGEFEPNGNAQFVWIFAGVAVFVLLIACVNFMNLATARAANRAKEVGIRKALGSQRSQLIIQFLAESFLLTFFAMVLALGIVELSLPFFNQLSGKALSGTHLHILSFWGTVGVMFLCVGLLAGTYPALVLSAFQPVKILKGMVKNSGGTFLRSSLVVFQFTASIILVIGTLVMFSQLRYIQSKDLGFNREQVLVIDDPGALGSNGSVNAFKQEVKGLSRVKSVSVARCLPFDAERHSQILWRNSTQRNKENSALIQTWTTDADFVRTMKMNIVRGRDFDATMHSDSSAIIINESLAREFFGQQEPLGKQIYTLANSDDVNSVLTFTVIGVIQDFHFSSLRENIQSVALVMGHYNGKVAIRFSGAQASSIVNQCQAIWKRIAPGKPFSYSFMDENFNAMYRTEQRTTKVLSIFTGLAIMVACLGLFALASFTTEQRMKEIGIRKVLGASVASIIGLLSKDFLKLVGIAIVVAVPLAWYGMSAWLRDFAYRVELLWWMFALSAAASVVIAFLTVAGQSWRAAQSNPVQSLRSE
ncbi:MAG: ABC transporter permease [Candidatus Kapabacteria bacterium]|nr:ABC transporter permease [Candidatus Kapabacteria bacterium]